MIEQRDIPRRLRLQYLGARVGRNIDGSEAEARSTESQRGSAVEIPQSPAHRRFYRALSGPSVSEANFGFGRVHIHIDRVGGDSDVEKERGPYSGHDCRSVS